ncbi:MAG: phosphohydrolase [Actinomycetota bacterium]|nr:phosphohydrolase [Actinomycetota bacterium]
MPAGPSTCPGNDRRSLTAGLYKCLECGTEVEMFSDELRRRCPSCGTMVVKEQAPSCILWCEHARECIGEERFRALTALSDEPTGPDA